MATVALMSVLVFHEPFHWSTGAKHRAGHCLKRGPDHRPRRLNPQENHDHDRSCSNSRPRQLARSRLRYPVRPGCAPVRVRDHPGHQRGRAHSQPAHAHGSA
ncbi:hypothetical protein LP419_26570 [Massilia sp. H-1]|nr:hypothetical protein LP419_26570 [Massilia sp. H-1]